MRIRIRTLPFNLMRIRIRNTAYKCLCVFCAQVEFYPHHGYLNISLTVWLGIYLFFIIERCLKIFMDSKARRRGEMVGGRHSHNAIPAKELENLLGASVGTYC
jgi:hypothetical protein